MNRQHQDENDNLEAEVTPFRNQVAGHSSAKDSNDLGMMTTNGFVLKPITKQKLGEREIAFYESLSTPQDTATKQLSLFVPRYFGTTDVWVKGRQVKFIRLEDACQGFSQPCIMDIKIGRQTWDPHATNEKIVAEMSKYAASKRELGFCIPGFQVYDLSSGKLHKFDSSYGKSLDGDGVKEAIRLFLNGDLSFSRSLLLQFLAKLWQILRWFRSQTNYHLFASSILLVYDAAKLRAHLRNGFKPMNGHDRPTIGRQLSLRVPTGPLTPGFDARSRSPETPRGSSRPSTPSTPDWNDVFDNVCKTHSLENNYDRDLQSMKENYSLVLKDLVEDRGASSSWVNVKMIDFAHVFPANSIDQNYLDGLSQLVNIFEDFLSEADL